MNRVQCFNATELNDESFLISLAFANKPQSSTARAILLKKYLPLILSLLSNYSKTKETAKELLPFAEQGFLIALSRFDANKGTSLGAYAKYYILSEIQRVVKCSQKYLSQKELFETYIDEDNFENFELHSCIKNNTEYSEQIESIEEAYDRKKLSDEIINFINTLSPRQQELVRMVFWEDLTLAEAARRMKIHRSRASQILASVIKNGKNKLKHLN